MCVCATASIDAVRLSNVLPSHTEHPSNTLIWSGSASKVLWLGQRDFVELYIKLVALGKQFVIKNWRWGVGGDS